MFSIDRPARGYFFELYYSLFGPQPLPYHTQCVFMACNKRNRRVLVVQAAVAKEGIYAFMTACSSLFIRDIIGGQPRSNTSLILQALLCKWCPLP